MLPARSVSATLSAPRRLRLVRGGEPAGGEGGWEGTAGSELPAVLLLTQLGCARVNAMAVCVLSLVYAAVQERFAAGAALSATRTSSRALAVRASWTVDVVILRYPPASIVVV